MSDTDEPASKFIDQYKNYGRTDATLQEERRQRLLEKQKRCREIELDAGRPGLLEELATEAHPDESMECQQNPATKQRPKKRIITSKLFTNKVQLSEWMHERPDDLENWLVRPCPVGQRCLLVFRQRLAIAFNKRGRSIAAVRTKQKLHDAIVLDCILGKDRTFYILDALVLAQVDLVNCDCQFRFAWIESKFYENNLTTLLEPKTVKGNDGFRLSLLPSYDLAHHESVANCWSHYPAFPEGTPKLDGYLFYHKESHYVYGKTPLVVWLFAFMLNDVLKLPPGLVNEQHLTDKPARYTGNYAEYIAEFDRMQAKRRSKPRAKSRSTAKMDTATDEPSGQHPDASLWEAMEAAPLDSDDEDLRAQEQDAMRQLEME
ncbi:snurportin-1 [Anopheles maculipalpis]|uniref:snurportin-1 n=1 Tax=Anopheles maculipalpis TaxID=1496333 RepID=UPI002158BADC|nr:snurportin-1 [Anopheles maculipalpis]